MLVKLRGGPHNGETIKVPDGAREWRVLVYEHSVFAAVEDIPAFTSFKYGYYRQGVAGSGNLWWEGVT